MSDWGSDDESLAEDIERFDRLDWPQQVMFVSGTAGMSPRLMRHIVRHGDPAARMALALRDDLPPFVRSMLSRDENRQVRSNLTRVRNDNGLAVGA